jgi:hypothetical protein
MFKYLLGLSALLLAGCGAFFSVKGIGLLFSGSFVASIIMASSLEFGKIMATSFLYRYWKKIILKTTISENFYGVVDWEKVLRLCSCLNKYLMLKI